MPPRLGAAEKTFSGLDFWTEMPKFHLSFALSINVLGQPLGTDVAATPHMASPLWQVTSSGSCPPVPEAEPLALPKAETQEPGPPQPRARLPTKPGGAAGWQRAGQSRKPRWFPTHSPGEKPQERPLMREGTNGSTLGLGQGPHHFGAAASIKPAWHMPPWGDGRAHASSLSSPALQRGRSHR